jgi:kynurenine formamidase
MGMVRRRMALTGMFATLGGLWTRGSAAATPQPNLLAQLRVVNLAHVHDPAQTNGFPGDPPFILETVATIPEDGFYLQYVKEGEHTGTHWGAPAHFNEGERFADQLDAQDLFRPAVKIDVRQLVRGNDDYAITIEDIKRWERRHGRIPSGAAIIFWTGWQDRWGTPAFPNLDDQGRIHQPGLSVEAMRWLLDTGRLARRGALGTDTFGADVGIDETFTVSTLLFHERRISLEVLANLERLPATGAWIQVGGPINRRGSGSPASIFALIPPGSVQQ